MQLDKNLQKFLVQVSEVVVSAVIVSQVAFYHNHGFQCFFKNMSSRDKHNKGELPY